MIKLLALDLDGTLFYPKRRFTLLTKKNTKFLQEFIENKKEIVLVSGRNYHISKKVSKKIGYSVNMIACNGSLIYKDNKIIIDYPIDHSLVRELINSSIDENIVSWVVMSDSYPMIIVPKGLNFFKKNFYRLGLAFQFAYRDDYIFGFDKLDELLNDKTARIYKVMAIYGLGKKNIQRAHEGQKKYIDAYGTMFEVFWSQQSIEFTNKGVNKANALKFLANMLKLSLDEVAVAGDSGNDVSLFENFENSFVMAHAPKQVKRKAKTEIRGVYCIGKYIKGEGEKNI